MSKTSKTDQQAAWFATPQAGQWQTQLLAVQKRFEREYRRETLELPAEVEAMPIFSEYKSGLLTGKTTSNFWELAQPQKKQRCLDIGCGFSFLIYPWREWEAFFYGQEISSFVKENVDKRGPQLNSMLYKGVVLGPAHQLNYEAGFFDLAIATGFSCYYGLAYWQLVLDEVKRVLKPGGYFVFDVLNPAVEMAENWAILEMYLGAEVYLEPLAEWEKLMKEHGGKIEKHAAGELFHLYKVKF